MQRPIFSHHIMSFPASLPSEHRQRGTLKEWMDAARLRTDIPGIASMPVSWAGQSLDLKLLSFDRRVGKLAWEDIQRLLKSIPLRPASAGQLGLYAEFHLWHEFVPALPRRIVCPGALLKIKAGYRMVCLYGARQLGLVSQDELSSNDLFLCAAKPKAAASAIKRAPGGMVVVPSRPALVS